MLRGSARRVVSTLLFLAAAAALGLVLLLSVEDALAHSLHAPAWAVALWRALVFGAGADGLCTHAPMVNCTTRAPR